MASLSDNDGAGSEFAATLQYASLHEKGTMKKGIKISRRLAAQIPAAPSLDYCVNAASATACVMISGRTERTQGFVWWRPK